MTTSTEREDTVSAIGGNIKVILVEGPGVNSSNNYALPEEEEDAVDDSKNYELPEEEDEE